MPNMYNARLYYLDNGVPTFVTADDDGHPGCSLGSRIEYTIPAGKPGFYLVRVEEYDNDQKGSFQVSAAVTNADRDVGGSNRTTAFTMANDGVSGRHVAADIQPAADEDWFRVELSEDEHVTFYTADLKGGVQTVIEIHDADPAILGYQRVTDAARRWLRRDVDGGVAPQTSRLHFVAPKSGTYFLRVTSQAGTSGAYSLYVQRMGNTATALPAYP